MLIISFPPSKSKNYDSAVKIAAEFENFVKAKDGYPNTLTLDDDKVFDNIYRLTALISIIQKFAGVTCDFNGRNYHPYAFIRDQQFILECQADCTDVKKHCCLDDIFEGWGCRFSRSIFRHLKGTAPYKDKRYWYNYGHFKDENTWIVDKAEITELLAKEVIEKNLHSCPHFAFVRMKHYVNGLPSEINLNSQYWQKFYIKDVMPDGTIQNVPINIRHVVSGNIFSTDDKTLAVELTVPEGLRRKNRDLPLS